MLTMKVMLWWAQKCGAEGLAWSSAELQQQRWQGCGPPDLLYRKLLPEAGLALSKALPLRLATASLRIRGGGRVVERSVRGWDVCGQHGQKLTKAFRDRGQAEAFADMTGEFVVLDMPVLWFDDVGTLSCIPLFGAGSVDAWTADERVSMKSKHSGGRSDGQREASDLHRDAAERPAREGPPLRSLDARNSDLRLHHG